MATYFFETMTDAQAAAYNPTADSLVFGGAGESAKTTTVRFNAASATQGATVSLISGVTGKVLTFAATGANNVAGGNFLLEDVVFPDSSKLFVGGTDTTNGDAVTGSAGTDGLYGNDGADT